MVVVYLQREGTSFLNPSSLLNCYEGGTYHYTYKAVSQWSSRLVPRSDIVEVDKIFVPVNQNRSHWGYAIVYMQEKRIQFYDSMRSDGVDYLKALFQYLKDEWARFNTEAFPNENEWRLIPNQEETPIQHNGYDWGFFTCMFADFIAKLSIAQ